MRHKCTVKETDKGQCNNMMLFQLKKNTHTNADPSTLPLYFTFVLLTKTKKLHLKYRELTHSHQTRNEQKCPERR